MTIGHPHGNIPPHTWYNTDPDAYGCRAHMEPIGPEDIFYSLPDVGSRSPDLCPFLHDETTGDHEIDHLRHGKNGQRTGNNLHTVQQKSSAKCVTGNSACIMIAHKSKKQTQQTGNGPFHLCLLTHDGNKTESHEDQKETFA